MTITNSPLVKNFSIHHKMTSDAIKLRELYHFCINQNRKLNEKQFITCYFTLSFYLKNKVKEFEISSFDKFYFSIAINFVFSAFVCKCLLHVHLISYTYTYLISFSFRHVYKVSMRSFLVLIYDATHQRA